MHAGGNEDILRRFFAEINKGEAAAIAAVDSMCSSDFVQHNAYGEDVRGLENYKSRVADLCRAFPDLHFAIDNAISAGDQVTSRMTMTGTQTGELHHIVNLSSTNKGLAVHWITIHRIKDGKFVEVWERFDTLGVMQQLGFAITKPRTDTSAEEKKTLMRHWFDESNSGKAAALAVVDETCAPGIVVHGITDIVGLENYRRFIGEVYDAFPDKHASLDDLIVEGDKVAIRFTETGTQKGAFMGIPPTDKKAIIRGIEIDRVVGGRFVEIWTIIDTPSMIRLGLVQAKRKRRPSGR